MCAVAANPPRTPAMGHAEPQVASTLQPFWMPFSANKEFKSEPRLFARAKGMYFYTPDGREVIDASAGLFCVAAGHCREEIAQAVYEQLQTLDFTAPFLRGHAKAFELAERITHYTPEGLNRVFFTNSGSEAVDTAMKIALAYHRVRGQAQRQLFVSRERAYHGVNMGGVALAGMVNNRRSLRPGAVRRVPHAAHRAAREPLRARPAGAGCRPGRRPAAPVQPVWRREHRGLSSSSPRPVPSVACRRPRAIWTACARSATQHGILLVFDEVITGWGRMGANFGAQAFGVTPDLMTMAKAVTNGAQPMGAVAAKQEVYDTITEAGPAKGVEFFHGYTYSAHPASCAAGLAMMDIFADVNA
jgi:beta-alanine--pyruvate transaminase